MTILAVRRFRRRARWRWWLRWGHNETALMHPLCEITLTGWHNIPAGNLLVIDPGLPNQETVTVAHRSNR